MIESLSRVADPVVAQASGLANLTSGLLIIFGLCLGFLGWQIHEKLIALLGFLVGLALSFPVVFWLLQKGSIPDYDMVIPLLLIGGGVGAYVAPLAERLFVAASSIVLGLVIGIFLSYESALLAPLIFLLPIGLGLAVWKVYKLGIILYTGAVGAALVGGGVAIISGSGSGSLLIPVGVFVTGVGYQLGVGERFEDWNDMTVELVEGAARVMQTVQTLRLRTEQTIRRWRRENDELSLRSVRSAAESMLTGTGKRTRTVFGTVRRQLRTERIAGGGGSAERRDTPEEGVTMTGETPEDAQESVPSSDNSERHATEKERQQGVYCSRCGTLAKPTANYCDECGAPLDDPLDRDMDSPTPSTVETLRRSFGVMRTKPQLLVPWIIIWIIGVVSSVLFGQLGLVDPGQTEQFGLGLLLFSVGFLLLYVAAWGSTFIHVETEYATLANFLLAMERLPKFVGAYMLWATSVVIGLVLFVLPGVVLIVKFALAPPAVFVDGLGPFGALKQSWGVTSGNYLTVLTLLGIFSVGTLLSLGLASGLGSIAGSVIIGPVQYLIHAFVAVGLSYAYVNSRKPPSMS